MNPPLGSPDVVTPHLAGTTAGPHRSRRQSRHSRSATIPRGTNYGDTGCRHYDGAHRRVGAQDLAAALNEIRMFFALLTRDGSIVWANRAAQTLGGCTLAELVGPPLPDVPWWASSAAAREVLPGALTHAAAARERPRRDRPRPGDSSIDSP